MPDLSDIHNFLDRLVDKGVSFVSLRHHCTRQRRQWTHIKSKRELETLGSREKWSLHGIVKGSRFFLQYEDFDSLKEGCLRKLPFLLEFKSLKIFKGHGNENLHPKPVRQLREKPVEHSALPPLEDLELQLLRLDENHLLNVRYQDGHYAVQYWDSEHTRGALEFVNQKLSLEQNQHQQTAQLNLYHGYSLNPNQEQGEWHDPHWQKDIRRWTRLLGEETFCGPSPEDFCWIFSPRAFAQLIQATLGPTLCSERPHPFDESMNPASLIDKQNFPECLSLHSTPSLFKDGAFLDDEGVVSRPLPLIVSGKLNNFLMSRSSAYQLSRSLPVHRELTLSGCSRLNGKDGRIAPDLRQISVDPGEPMEKDFRLSHLFIQQVNVEPLDDLNNSFLISAHNVLVNKFGGQHRRLIPQLQCCINRDELWSKCLGLGQETVRVHLPGKWQQRGEPFSVFQVPMAKFRGLPCSWS